MGICETTSISLTDCIYRTRYSNGAISTKRQDSSCATVPCWWCQGSTALHCYIGVVRNANNLSVVVTALAILVNQRGQQVQSVARNTHYFVSLPRTRSSPLRLVDKH